MISILTKNLKLFKKFAAVLLSLTIVATILSVAIVSASAVAYSGKGTKSDPFLIQTVEQLQGIKDNLAGHYKLANTIDCASVSNFGVIGNLKTPFTGSLTCDVNSDGTPKFIIKNLKISNTNHEYSKGSALDTTKNNANYKEDGSSGWETALFGAAKGATFQNIFIANANINSTVIGSSDMDSTGSSVFGVDEQATAILLGIGVDITMTKCGVSGNVNSRSNHTASLVGIVTSAIKSNKTGKVIKSMQGTGKSSITNCYSYANVKSGGSWCAGGLIADLNAGTLTGSFYDGTFEGGWRIKGALVGSNNSKILNCYSAGLVKTGSCFVGYNEQTSTEANSVKNVSNSICRASNASNQSNNYTYANVQNNCYLASDASAKNGKGQTCYPTQQKFVGKTKAELRNIFASISGWTIPKDGGYPIPSGLAPVTASMVAKYTVNPVTAPTDGVDNATTSQSTEGTEGTTEGAEGDGQTEGSTGSSAAIDENTLKAIELANKQLSSAEKLLIIVLAVFSVLLLAATVWFVIMTISILKKDKPATANIEDVSSNSENQTEQQEDI